MSTSTQQEPEKLKALRNEQESLKNELKELEHTLEAAQNDLSKSKKMKERFESLSKELENRTEEIKAESRSKMQQAEDQSKSLADEVSTNMGFMDNVNKTLSQISCDRELAKHENDELADQIATLKSHYDEREQSLQVSLTEAHNQLIASQTALAQMKLKNAEDKEKLFSEMQSVAQKIMESKQEMKEAKETELGLRVLLQKYDEKFGGLQTALQETNTSYDLFRQEMDSMGGKTKELEKEAIKWQMRWEESNNGLLEMSKNHEVLQKDLTQLHEKLVRMTSLCRALQKENAELEKQLSDSTKN